MYKGLSGHDDLVADANKMVAALVAHTQYEKWRIDCEVHDLSGEKDDNWAKAEWSVPACRLLIRIDPTIQTSPFWRLEEILAHEVAHAVLNLTKEAKETEIEEAADAVGLMLIAKTRAMEGL